MEAETSEIIHLRSDQLPSAAGVLGRAFFNDPLMIFYLPDPSRREKIIPSLMLASLRYCHFYGEVYTTADFEGVACWLPPGQTEMNTFGLIRAGLGVVPIRIGIEALLRVAQIEPAVNRIHKASVPGPHWYLMILGVEPEKQGKGIGGRLLSSKISEAKESRLPFYLETMTKKNVAFYIRQGFRVVFETDLPPGNLHTWMMIHP